MDSITSVQNKNFSGNKKNFQKFLEPTRKQKVIYTDNSQEFGRACEDLSWNHCTSTPRRSETSGIAERAVRRIEEGTRRVLLQSGLDQQWWADSMECYCYLRNVQDLLSGGKTPYEQRFGEPFKGPTIPFGSMIEDHPTSAKDLSGLHQLGKKVYLQYSSDMPSTRGESGKGKFWPQTLRSWKGWTHQKSTQEDSMQKR